MKVNREATLDELKTIARPSGFAVVRLGLDPYPWQRAVMDSIHKENTRAAFRGCNSSGKTSEIITTLVFWHMETFPGSMCVTMSASNRQIKFQLYPQLKRLAPRLGRGWRVRDSNEYSVKAPNGSMCVSFSTTDPERAEGYHKWDAPDFFDNWAPPAEWDLDWSPDSKAPLLIIFDEAKGIGDDKFDAASRCMATRELHASSPGEPKGRFYDGFNSMKAYFRNIEGGYNLFHANVFDCPHLIDDPAVRNQFETDVETRGEHDWLVQSKWYGEFASSGERMVFDLVNVDDCMADATLHYNIGERRAAVDVGGGGDPTKMYMRDGNRCWLDSTFNERDSERLADKLVQRFELNCMRPWWVRVDAGGIGSPLCDKLKARGWDVERMHFDDAPRRPRLYGNARSEMFAELAQRINGREIILPRNSKLKEELGWIKYKVEEGDGRLFLEKKSSLPHSTNEADTVAMLYYKTPRRDSYLRGDIERQRKRGRCSPLPGNEWNISEPDQEQGALLY